MSSHLLQVVTTSFEAARSLANLPIGHRARRLHGHSFSVQVRAALAKGALQSFPGGEGLELQRHLGEVIAPLDYDCLDSHLPVPSDTNLARWLWERLALTELEIISVHSTPMQGVKRDERGQCYLWRRFRFEAAHWLPRVGPEHPCGQLHGHGFEVELQVHQQKDELDSVVFDHLTTLWQPLYQKLHLACLNDLPGLANPTSEVLCHWLWQQLKPICPALSRVSVHETASAGCHYNGQIYRIWKDLRFDSALRLARAPLGEARRGIHGHSYLVRLYLSAPLDAMLGWTVDYGEVKALFEPLYRRLDHHAIHELPDVEDADSASVAQWLRSRIQDALPALDRLDLYETPGCGVILSWGE